MIFLQLIISVNIRPALCHWLQVKCKAGRRLLGQPHWPNVSYLVQVAGNQEAESVTWTGSYTASHLVSAVLVPRERTVQQQRAEFVQMRQSGRGPTLLRRVHAAPADTAPLYDTFQKHSNVGGLLTGLLLTVLPDLTSEDYISDIQSASSAATEISHGYANMSHKCEASLRVTQRIFKLFSPSTITHNNQDKNQTVLITVVFRCTLQGKSPPGRKQECSGGDVGHLKNVIFKSWQLQLILQWFMNFYISFSYTRTYMCACVHKLPLFFHCFFF